MNRCLAFFRKISSLKFFQKRGFSLIELLTATSVVGILSVVGVKSYQAQTNKARSAEAKHSLSYIYVAEINFKSSWETYHENLMLIGAVPSGSYYYDVGFERGASANMSKTEGNLGNYPLPSTLTVKECVNFYQICDGTCITKTKAAVRAMGHYFTGTATCRVTGGLYLGGGTPLYTKPGSTASENLFKAFAVGKLKGDDVWSIDQKRQIEHLEDGTQ